MAVWVRFWCSTRFARKEKNAAWTGPCRTGSCIEMERQSSKPLWPASHFHLGDETLYKTLFEMSKYSKEAVVNLIQDVLETYNMLCFLFN